MVVPTGLLFAIVLPFLAFGPGLESWTTSQMEGEGHIVIAILSFGLLAGDILLPIPSSLVSLTTGAALGLWSGALVIWFGMTAGCLIGWVVGCGLLAPVERRLTETPFGLPTGIWGLILCRPVPVLAELSVIMAAARGMPLRPLMLACGLANTPIAALYGLFGARLLGEVPFSYFLSGVGAASVLAVAVAVLWIRGRPRRDTQI